MSLDDYDYIVMKRHSHEVFKSFKNSIRGWGPDSVADLLEIARLDWLSDFTNIIDSWKEIAESDMISKMTEGQLLLAYTTLGALVEGWLKLFYCAHYESYKDETSQQIYMNVPGAATQITPNELSFEKLKVFSRDIIWDKGEPFDLWVDKIQQRRNAIHAFNDRNIGTPQEYLADIGMYCEFVDELYTRLPDMP